MNAINNVSGLQLVDEEELTLDGQAKPIAYLMVPDALALKHIASLWRMWSQGQKLPTGFTPWRDVFACLRDLRPWGPSDRVQPSDAGTLADEIEFLADMDMVPLEIEIVFRDRPTAAQANETAVTDAVITAGGQVVSRLKLETIAYHALLARLPVWAIRRIITLSIESLAGMDAVMFIRPQSVVSRIEVEDVAQSTSPSAIDRQYGVPILGILDGVPLARHPLLQSHLTVEDLFGLEPITPVADRLHGTAMASLIVHGDRNRPEPPILRRIHSIPVLGGADEFPPDRLIVDLIYQAIFAMRGGPTPSAQHVIVVNISLGNPRRQFYGQLSPWARLLDRLAYQFGILFIVSAGNVTTPFPVPAFANSTQFEDASPQRRAAAMVQALGGIAADRRLFSPSETINGLTVGARNADWVPEADRVYARTRIDPYPSLDTANPSSALGPGFGESVKPDVLMPGAREHLRMVSAGDSVVMAPAPAGRGAGLKVASPPGPSGFDNAEGFTNGTSAAAALASRTAHRIHDALETEYGQEFLTIPAAQRAVLLKALLVHPARWPDATADLVKSLLGPRGQGQAGRQKDNIRRFLGYGTLDPDDAVACAADRATFWTVGQLGNEQTVNVAVPIPLPIGGRARPHLISATLAWFTPVVPGRKSYRSVRMKIIAPDGMEQLGVQAHGRQPDHHQIARGTLLSRCWQGDSAAVVTPEMTIPFRVQREPDQGTTIDDQIPFALAVTIAMPGQIDLYQELQARVRPLPIAR